MVNGNWITLLLRQTACFGPIGWDEIIVGQDFGFLGPGEIQAWAHTVPDPTPAVMRLVALEGDALLGFEACLWAACTEAQGRPLRPGGRRWARAQDRWRVALLKDALEAPLTDAALGLVVETVYERVGCPEDMLGLWHLAAPWQRAEPMANRPAIARFLERWEPDFSLVG